MKKLLLILLAAALTAFAVFGVLDELNTTEENVKKSLFLSIANGGMNVDHESEREG